MQRRSVSPFPALVPGLAALLLALQPIALARASAEAAPPHDSAPVPSDMGFSLGLRSGYGLPIGNAQQGAPMGDAFAGMVPLWLDVLYRFTPEFSAGLYAQYGVAIMSGGACGSAVSCSGMQARTGLEVQHRFTPEGPVGPWIGLGLGYELVSYGGSERRASHDYTGFEYLHLEAGLELGTPGHLWIGPFISGSLSQFLWEATPAPVNLSNANGDFSAQTTNGIPKQSLHGWLTLGLRVMYDL